MPDKLNQSALKILETQLARLRAIVAGYEDRGQPIPFETQLALDDILKQIDEMATAKPTRQ